MVISFDKLNQLFVGRGVKDEIRIDDISVSRRHAVFKLKVDKKTANSEIWL